MTPQNETVLAGKVANIEQYLLRIAEAVEAIAKASNPEFKTKADLAAKPHIPGMGRRH